MTGEQLTLLDHATSKLEKIRHCSIKSMRVLPLPRKTVGEQLNISSSTLNRAKRENNLSYKTSYKNQSTEIYYSHREKNRDYWLVYLN
ncbi:hypothetical protein [Geminocystis sp. GBBB08]|uniref:hypothetical protein n=1 Tax=Geminocystis sp. GBBB08 TaxID=2604140 RepID=UPI0027E2F7B8|nr:hypothetical protein [Geminocystis sp. GBBB08]MBL1210684.1 hypothetical protein [Geminocystis sp. GBBB08]